MNGDARASVLAALREIFDGSWTRRVGTDGGRMLDWSGKCGFVGAVTPTIDRHHAVMGALGERFVFYRGHVDDARAQAKRRLRNRSLERQMRQELAGAVVDVLAVVDRDAKPRDLSDAEVDALVDLAAFVVVARTSVERDGFSRDVEVMPIAEAPGRLVGSLGALLSGIEAIGASTETAWRIVRKVALDCIPDVRRQVLDHLLSGASATGNGISNSTKIPNSTMRRTLEDLYLLGLVDRVRDGPNLNAPVRHFLANSCRVDWAKMRDATP